MSKERNTELEKTDPLEQKLKQMLSEELSDIQVSEELIQRTLQAAQKARIPEVSKEIEGKMAQKSRREDTGENRAQKQKYRIHIFRGCAVAAALLVVLGLGFRSIRFSMKSDHAEGGNSTAYDAEGFDGYGHYFENEGSYKGEPESSGSSQEASGGQLEDDSDSMQMPQQVPTSYPGEWTDGAASNEADLCEDGEDNNNTTGDGSLKPEYNPEATSPADIVTNKREKEDIERELLISKAVELLLSDMDEIAGVAPLDDFSDAKEADGEQCAYREFRYASDEGKKIEIIGRVYPDGYLEGKLAMSGQIAYKAVASQPEMERLWELLNVKTTNEEME